MKLKKFIAMLLLATMLVSALAVSALAASWQQDATVTAASTNQYGSRYSDNREDYFAEALFDEATEKNKAYVMPDKYNTGHVTAYEDLVDFGEKYPDVPANVTDKGVKYTINAAAAQKYNYLFEGFKVEHGYIYVEAQGVTVVLRDFYLNAYHANTDYDYNVDTVTDASFGTAISTPRKIEDRSHPHYGEYYNGRLVVLDGEIIGSSHAQISGFNVTVRRCYMHHCQADHIKGFTGQVIVGNLVCEGGLNGSNYHNKNHPDCIQYTVDDGHGKGLATTDVYVYGNRFDIPMITLKDTSLPAGKQNYPIYATNAVVMLQSEFLIPGSTELIGGLRNINICKNWMNGGGVSMQVTTKGHMEFFENINICDNVFGHGESYKDTFIMWGKDYDGVSLGKKTNATGNVGITELYAGSVAYYNNGERIYNLAQATGSLSVKTVISNYLLSEQKAVVKVDVVNASGEVIGTKYQSANINRYLPHSEVTKFDISTNFRYKDLPTNIEIDVDFGVIEGLEENCQVQVTVFHEHSGKALELIRKDNLLYNDAEQQNISVTVPEGYTFYDTDANSPSNLFKNAVNACKNKQGDALREALMEAANYYPDIDENVNGVTEAKNKYNEYIEVYNASIAENNVLMEQGLEISAKFTGISEWFRDIFESFFAFIRRLFAWA